MEKDVLGILVSYKIHIHLMVAGAGYVPVTALWHIPVYCRRLVVVMVYLSLSLWYGDISNNYIHVFLHIAC